MNKGNLFDDTQPPAKGERFEALLRHRNLVVERILSSADTPPTRFVQTQDEWVLLVRGHATLDVDGTPKPLEAGDYLFLPAGTPHTVLQVSDGALWLAVHLGPDGSGEQSA
jgi:cupin 2 domain-containing protein